MARPRKPKLAPEFDPAAIDTLLGGRQTAEELEDLFRQMKKVLMEKVMAGELTHHLGYARGAEKPAGQANHRNGTSPKTVLTEDGAIPLEIPRDRAGTFVPQLVPKNARRLRRFDQNVLSLYARGMTMSEIREHLQELYQVDVAPEFISTVTDEVLDEVTAWQQRPLDACYPVVLFDALRVKIRDEGLVKNKAIYLALGITRSGTKDVLGLWVEQTEGAKFWHRVMTELKARGVDDILIALIDGLTGFPLRFRRCFRTRRSTPASSISCGGASPSCRTRTGNASPRPSVRCATSRNAGTRTRVAGGRDALRCALSRSLCAGAPLFVTRTLTHKKPDTAAGSELHRRIWCRIALVQGSPKPFRRHARVVR
jgi:hypothetical protein